MEAGDQAHRNGAFDSTEAIEVVAIVSKAKEVASSMQVRG